MSEVPFAETEMWVAMPVEPTPLFEANLHPCGLDPVEYNVIIDQNPVETKTSGGLHIPNEVQEKRMHQETRGIIIEASPLAFTYENWPEGSRIPKVGDRVAFAQHTGAFIDGQDGKKYRVVKDKDILAVLR